MNSIDNKKDAFEKMLKIMHDIRSACPWDREQTNQSLRTLTIEETYELSDAVMQNDTNSIKKE